VRDGSVDEGEVLMRILSCVLCAPFKQPISNGCPVSTKSVACRLLRQESSILFKVFNDKKVLLGLLARLHNGRVQRSIWHVTSLTGKKFHVYFTEGKLRKG